MPPQVLFGQFNRFLQPPHDLLPGHLSNGERLLAFSTTSLVLKGIPLSLCRIAGFDLICLNGAGRGNTRAAAVFCPVAPGPNQLHPFDVALRFCLP